jgi:WD40 repeat protein
VIELATGEPRLLRGHDGPVVAVQWLADGRLVSTSSDLSVRVWNLADGSVKILRGHTKPVVAVDVAGDAALTIARDGTARLWDLRTEVGRPLLGHDTAPIFAGFGAAGELLVLDGDGRLSVYRDDTPSGEAALRVWIAALTLGATPR